jgi:nicotinamide mononucleotide (NMN) deamidase PncC
MNNNYSDLFQVDITGLNVQKAISFSNIFTINLDTMFLYSYVSVTTFVAMTMNKINATTTNYGITLTGSANGK